MPLSLYNDAEKGTLDLAGKPVEIHVIPVHSFKEGGPLSPSRVAKPPAPQKPKNAKVSNYVRFIVWFNTYR